MSEPQQAATGPETKDDGLTPEQRVAGLLTLLDVQPVPDEERAFVGLRKPGGVGRVYGGQVVAQALVAAMKTAPDDRPVHSLHAYFLRGGDEAQKVGYRVEADFEGRSFANRRVIAGQKEGVILNLAASFHKREAGRDYQAPMPSVDAPENLPTVAEYLADHPDCANPLTLRFLSRPGPMEIRCIGVPPLCVTEPMEPALSFWFRTTAPVRADQPMHRALLAYASDLALLTTSMRPHGAFRYQVASLDHSLWFHRDVQADDWLLYQIASPWSGAARGLSFGHFYDRAGNLVATAAQEGLIREVEPREE